MRPDLMALVGHRVTITNPGGSSWTGKLTAVGDEPCVVIDQDHGPRICLPQSFTVTKTDEPHATVQPGDPGPVYTWPNVPPTADIVTGARIPGWPDIRTVANQLDRLDGMLANLTAHIEQRAQELAQPLIAKAREAALTDVERARHDQQRAEDLVTELRRQIRAPERRRDEQLQRTDKAAADVARVRQLHAEIPHKPGTCYCANPHPCPTIRALDGQEPDRG